MCSNSINILFVRYNSAVPPLLTMIKFLYCFGVLATTEKVVIHIYTAHIRLDGCPATYQSHRTLLFAVFNEQFVKIKFGFSVQNCQPCLCPTRFCSKRQQVAVPPVANLLATWCLIVSLP